MRFSAPLSSFTRDVKARSHLSADGILIIGINLFEDGQTILADAPTGFLDFFCGFSFNDKGAHQFRRFFLVADVTGAADDRMVRFEHDFCLPLKNFAVCCRTVVFHVAAECLRMKVSQSGCARVVMVEWFL